MLRFPADVSLRVDGSDIDAAQRLFPAARNLLFRALRRQELEGVPNINMLLPFTDGSLVSVILRGALKHVYVKPAVPGRAPPGADARRREEPEPQEELYIMLSGVVSSGGHSPSQPIVYANDADPPALLLSRFHPSAVTADAYNLTPGWQDIAQLAVSNGGTHAAGSPTSWYPKPGMYSGKMQHIVQALLGIGRTASANTDEYLTGIPRPPDQDGQINVYNAYDYRWVRSHGTYLSEGGDRWLVEISREEGILAMPLRFFTGTEEIEYRNYLSSIGDTDTVFMLDTIGGLPTGETFPSGAALTDAIANGKVLRLLEAEDIEEFYHDSGLDVEKKGLFTQCGWAFSANGSKAVNTSFWYRNEDVVFEAQSWSFGTPIEDQWSPASVAAGADERYMVAELWKIDISLSNFADGVISDTNPIGTGSASINREEQELWWDDPDSRLFDPRAFEGDGYHTWQRDPVMVPTDSSERLHHFYHFGAGAHWPNLGDPESAESAEYTAARMAEPAVFAFYLDEDLEIVRRRQLSTSFGNIIYAGNSFDPRSVDAGVWNASLFIPAYCREGYALTWLLSPSTTVTVGFFGRMGIITFPERSDADDTQWFYDITLSMYPLRMPTPEVSGPSIDFGLVANALNTPGYVATRGWNRIGPGAFGAYYADNGYVQSDTIAQFEIPENGTARGITFVGAP